MTRQDFIENQWQRYPSIPAHLLGNPVWVWGEVSSVSKVEISLNQQKAYRLAGETDSENSRYLGPSMRAHLLISGDRVGLKLDESGGIGAVFLLSPRLQSSGFSVNSGWQSFLKKATDFWESQEFTHWKTPTLVTSPGVDAHIDFVEAKGVRTGRQWFLPTSPEIELKKVIGTGVDQIFEIKSVYRDDDKSDHHNPEFTMLEWYRAYGDKWSLLRDIAGFVRSIEGMESFPRRVPAMSVSELFEKYIGFVLRPKTTQEELVQVVESQGLDMDPTDDWDDLFFRIFVDLIEPELKKEGPLAVYDYPSSQSSLARLTEDGWADRFEFYWNGVEIANAYQEQTDPSVIEATIRNEIKKRKDLGRKAFPMDASFLKVYQSGFPPCAGAALGLERLFMVIKNESKI